MEVSRSMRLIEADAVGIIDGNWGVEFIGFRGQYT
jgi:hypothetical protein